MKHVLEIHHVKEFIEVIEYQNSFWSDFVKMVGFWSDLVRFSVKIDQMVSQNLKGFSQILIISTLVEAEISHEV